MKAASSDNNTIPFASRQVMAAIAGALAITAFGFGAASDLRAETPAADIKAAGAIPLTTELLDKMDKFIKSVNADAAAKAELTPVNKDQSITPETWGSVVSAKCPKTVEIFKASGLTPDEFAKAICAIIVLWGDDLSKSEDKTAQANAGFVAANKDRIDDTLSAYLRLADPEPST